ncbi:HlyD family type I secretion periplasmic adaptor subunit [Rhodoplanes sp. TEM]|uniref:Membrane fusion protein (MFP) family protein n=1 Tax=Rhodoplanes tepidamans TaxID=200616 RepID=A0ABT5JIP0_RHOTP|nr:MULTISPECIES: HlyD family type I secretion periplasmic adaptor subunit [Rhodoplanes]MDC7789434.1 HlyD family type I secretion periplasmic adaptor subunit [Rhodoplanes tepidamans]MDC7985429.1 HlyD family type I secretion periplasmic adaptor subunit [Rhodoplanes sp. TEM]MDQ0353607.1 HlyD family secretion protein [Rhodoplanes tepidamans]
MRLPLRPADDVDGVFRPLRIGLLTCAVAVVGLGGAATVVEIAGAVLARGTVVVEGSPKKVQHPTGGVVGRIHVAEGAAVREGDVVLTLDDTMTRANLMVLVRQIDQMEIRQARLTAERNAHASFDLPPALVPRAADNELDDQFAAERRLFESRREARAGQKAQLGERVAQLEQEVTGLMQQKDAKDREIEFVGRELEGARVLWEKSLLPVTKFTAIQRDAARLSGEAGLLVSQAAQARGRIAEIRLQIEQIDQDLRAETMRELSELQAKLAELAEKRIAAEDQLRRVELRAPQAGIVHQLAAHTVGGVVAAGETLMEIVPQDDALVVEARLAAADIDSVRPGQRAWVRFPAFSQDTTPEIEGVVQRVSADVVRDRGGARNSAPAAAPGQDHYIVRVLLPAEIRTPAHRVALLPGMPADVHLGTGDRTILSYLVKPLRDQLATTFRER